LEKTSGSEDLPPIVISVLLVFLPVLGAPILHAPVLKFDLLRPLKRPLDGGARLHGHRVFGDNKTWRGALMMCLGVVLATAALAHWPWYWEHLPGDVRRLGSTALGLVLGVATVAGELPNSMLKRQFRISPGQRVSSPMGIALSILDQGDLVIAVFILLLPVWSVPFAYALVAFVVVAIIHLSLSQIGHAVGIFARR
jgi:hypothetical protein